MPASSRTRALLSSSPSPDEMPDTLRAYDFHGIELTIKEAGRQGIGECPFCAGSNKFTVEVSTSKFRCWSCGVTGNARTFIELLYEVCLSRTDLDFIEEVTADRKLTDPSTVITWGVCKSVIPPNHWLIPGYDVEGKLTQLYKRTHLKGSDGQWSWRLLPTPGIWEPGKVHALHLAKTDFDPKRQRIDILEGPWDGMAYWEVIQATAAAGDSNVVAVPGCNVWRDEWTSKLCAGKDVTLWYDSDYPRASGVNGKGSAQPGHDGMQRVSKRLSSHALSVSYVKWGEEGYDPTHPDGWDVRDALSSSEDRLEGLRQLVPLIHPVPNDWFSPAHPQANGVIANGAVRTPAIEPESCETWAKCKAAWEDAMEWRQELSDVLITMLGVSTSTNQSGENQLFLRVIADPGSAKTRLCKGLLVSKHCKIVLHLKNFHSGFKKPGEDDVDCSFVARISGKCMVTPEADALTSGGNTDQLDSQARQIFDGETASTYANSDEDRHYKGLRSSWIQAGTPILMDKDQSRLGDRFLRIRIEQPEEDVKRAILMKSIENELSAVVETSNGTESSIIPPKLRKAYAVTGGYVDWLRANAEEKLQEVRSGMSKEHKIQCLDLGTLAAELRARPNMDMKKMETFHSKELPTRLVSQFARLAVCIAVVLNKPTVDDEVMRIVRKVALDTAHGHTLNIVTWLCTRNPGDPEKTYQESGGIQEKRLAPWCQLTPERMSHYLSFLRKIGVVVSAPSPQGTMWSLTPRIYDLYLRVMSR